MITFFVTDNKQEELFRFLNKLLNKVGNNTFVVIKDAQTIKILENEDLTSLVSLEDKILEFEEAIFHENKGTLYKKMLEAFEKPVIEYVLQRVFGNQFKSARILGINRNTMRAKIKKLGIDSKNYKS
mgnify:FL=1